MRRWFAAGVMIFLVSLLVAGCGIPQEDYDAVIAEREAAEAQAASLRGQLTTASSEASRAKGDLAGVQSELVKVNNELEAARKEAESAKSAASNAQSQLPAVKSEASKAKSDLEAAEAEIAELEVKIKAFELAEAKAYWGFIAWGTEYKETPGTKVILVKKDEGTKDGKHFINYNMIATGLPKDKVYYLWEKALADAAPSRLFEVKINDEGYVCLGTQPISFLASGFAKGEALEVALMTEDKSIIAYGKRFPYPIGSKTDSCRIWVQLLSTKGTAFVIWGDGFEPDEVIEATSTSNGEVLESKIEVGSDGQYIEIIFPAVVGKESGTATYTAVGKAGELKVSYKWGAPALVAGP